MNYLEEDKIILEKKDNQLLTLYYDDKTYFAIKAIRCFPLSNPDSYISLQYEENEENIEIGIIKSLSKLNDANQKLLKDELELRYFMPEIIKIEKKSYRRRFYSFNAITSSGNKEIKVKDLVYSLYPTKDGALLIKDVDENYYIIRNYKESKNKQIKFLRSFI